MTQDPGNEQDGFDADDDTPTETPGTEREEPQAEPEAPVAPKYLTQADIDELWNTRAAELNNALRRIASAPATDDGPVAPVLKRELDSLRSVAPPDPGPDGIDQVGSSPAAGVDAKHDLSAPAGAPGS